MISFKDFLTESRSAPLYHATHPDNFEGIVKSNILHRGLEDTNHPGKTGKIISTTRNFVFAVEWASIILELDQQKLAQRYKIMPFSYFSYDGMSPGRKQPTINYGTVPWQKGFNYTFTNQFEEAILQDIKDPFKYVTKIYTSSSALREKIMKLLPEKYNYIPVLMVSEYKLK